MVADSDEKLEDKIQDLTEVLSALLSWYLAIIVSTNAIRRAATSSTQNRRETRTGDRLTFSNKNSKVGTNRYIPMLCK